VCRATPFLFRGAGVVAKKRTGCDVSGMKKTTATKPNLRIHRKIKGWARELIRGHPELSVHYLLSDADKGSGDVRISTECYDRIITAIHNLTLSSLRTATRHHLTVHNNDASTTTHRPPDVDRPIHPFLLQSQPSENRRPRRVLRLNHSDVAAGTCMLTRSASLLQDQSKEKRKKK